MSNFEKYAVKGTCECCNKETNVVVCSSGIVPISFSYCKECLNNGIEPYSALVCASAGVGVFPNDFLPLTSSSYIPMDRANRNDRPFLFYCTLFRYLVT